MSALINLVAHGWAANCAAVRVDRGRIIPGNWNDGTKSNHFDHLELVRGFLRETLIKSLLVGRPDLPDVAISHCRYKACRSVGR